MFKLTKKMITLVSCITIFCMVVTFNVKKASAVENLQAKQLTYKEYTKMIDNIPEIVYEKHPDLKPFMKNFKEEIIKNKSIEKAVEIVKKTDEYKTLNEKFDGSGVEPTYSKGNIDTDKLLQNKEINDSVERIDKMAKDFYDYYCKNGKLPDYNSENNIDDLKINMTVTAASSTGVVAELAELGYYLANEAEVALQCATIGVIAGLSSALPTIALIALVAGAFILTTYVIYNLVQNSIAVTNYIAQTSYSASVKATQAISTSNVYRQNPTARHFYCHLASGGGVVLMYPVDFQTAVWIMMNRNDQENVLSQYYKDADDVANAASDAASMCVWDGAHPGSSLNLPHYHARYAFWFRYAGHSFHL